MAKPKAKFSVTVAKLVKQFGGKAVNCKKSLTINGFASLASAKKGDLSFYYAHNFLDDLKKTNAGVVVVQEKDVKLRSSKSCIVVEENPRVWFVKVVNAYSNKLEFLAGIDSTASIDKTAKIDKSVHVGPHVVIGKNVVVKKNSQIRTRAVIGEGTKIGEGCVIHEGCVIGAEGFGFVEQNKVPVRMQHQGNVIIESFVEVGANSCVDRGFLDDTIIGEHTKIDNLVQIGHNVVIGKSCTICGQVGIGGSAKIGNNCTIAGQVGVPDNLTICDNVVIMGGTVVTGNINKSGIYGNVLPMFNQNKLHLLWRKLLKLMGGYYDKK